MRDIYYPVAHRSQEEIDSFKSRYEDFDSSLIPAIFNTSLNLSVTDWKPSNSWGSSHVIYFVETKEKGPLVLRANTGFNKQPEVMMLTEKLIAEKVSGVGVPTNKVLYADVSRTKFQFDFQIQEVLKGKDPEIYFKGSKEDYDQISYELGVNVAKYHQLVFGGFGRFDEKLVPNGELAGTKNSFFEYVIVNLDEDVEYLIQKEVVNDIKAKQIKSLFREYKKIINTDKGVLVHHDLADHNITFEGSHLTGIFDWETAVVGDPVLDLASCPTWKTIYPRKEKLLEGYQTISGLPDHFEEKWNIYQLRTMLWKMVYAIRANILNESRKQLFYESLKPFGLY